MNSQRGSNRPSMCLAELPQRGGKKPLAGRAMHATVRARVPMAMHDWVMSHGGTDWLRAIIAKEMAIESAHLHGPAAGLPKPTKPIRRGTKAKRRKLKPL